jgi:mono/diheme cytochrome c family protein
MRNILMGITAMLFLSVGTSALAQTQAHRGKALYDLQCIQCHRDSLHKRPKPAAQNYADVRNWVILWAKQVGAQWGEEEIEAVTSYLNQHYYSFATP